MFADDERQQVLAEYRETSRRFADSVERLGTLQSDTEAFIRALGETGAAHRACEKLRIRLDKHLARFDEQPVGRRRTQED